MIIIISGSVGTGKTTLAKRLATSLKHTYVNVKAIISKNNIAEDYDTRRRCHIVDTKKLTRFLIKKIKAVWPGEESTCAWKK